MAEKQWHQTGSGSGPRIHAVVALALGHGTKRDAFTDNSIDPWGLWYFLPVKIQVTPSHQLWKEKTGSKLCLINPG